MLLKGNQGRPKCILKGPTLNKACHGKPPVTGQPSVSPGQGEPMALSFPRVPAMALGPGNLFGDAVEAPETRPAAG